MFPGWPSVVRASRPKVPVAIVLDLRTDTGIVKERMIRDRPHRDAAHRADDHFVEQSAPIRIPRLPISDSGCYPRAFRKEDDRDGTFQSDLRLSRDILAQLARMFGLFYSAAASTRSEKSISSSSVSRMTVAVRFKPSEE